MSEPRDPERNRLAARLGRAATLGANLTGAAASAGAAALFGGEGTDAQIAAALRQALGRSKGPLMKVAQMLATIPDLLPPDYARELRQLMANAPAMGRPFVERRMRAELGADWRTKFQSFDPDASAAASLGQVHRAVALDGRAFACKLQYPDMMSAVESDLDQLRGVFALVKRMGKAVDPTEIGEEMGARLREELDYERERRHIALFAHMLANVDAIALPEPIGALSTKRLLTMTWLDGHPLTDFLSAAQETRNRIATLLFRAWWTPMGQYGIIHGDPHLGNYSFAGDADQLNLLDLGCVRVFSPTFVDGVLKLRSGLEHDDADLIEEAYTLWGFAPLDAQIIDALNIWARFLYAPLLDRRVRKATGDVDPSEYGRREIIEMKRRLMAAARPVTIPREFVLLDRAVIGLGAAFLHLRAELNFAALFDACIEGFSPQTLGVRQDAALGHAGLA